MAFSHIHSDDTMIRWHGHILQPNPLHPIAQAIYDCHIYVPFSVCAVFHLPKQFQIFTCKNAYGNAIFIIFQNALRGAANTIHKQIQCQIIVCRISIRDMTNTIH